jgi:hypothetical protein
MTHQITKPKMTKKKYIFIIKNNKTKTAYTASGPYQQAVKALHTILRTKNPKTWTPNWKDLLNDIKNGEQTCYEVHEIYDLTLSLQFYKEIETGTYHCTTKNKGDCL